jgi:hypothetical protein
MPLPVETTTAMPPTISIVYPDGVWKEESEVKEQWRTTCGRGYRRNELVDLDEENNCFHEQQAAPGSFLAATHGELACYDVERGAGKVAAAAGVRQHHHQGSPGAASEKKTVSFAAAVIRDSDDSMILAESNRLEDNATTTAAAAAEQRRTQRRYEHREPSLPVHVIAVVGHRQGGDGAGAGGRRVGDETTTISTLSFGHKTHVQVTTPRETPSFYVGVGLALVVVAVSAFLIAFYLTMRPR